MYYPGDPTLTVQLISHSAIDECRKWSFSFFSSILFVKRKSMLTEIFLEQNDKHSSLFVQSRSFCYIISPICYIIIGTFIHPFIYLFLKQVFYLHLRGTLTWWLDMNSELGHLGSGLFCSIFTVWLWPSYLSSSASIFSSANRNKTRILS